MGGLGWYASDVPRILVVDDEPDVTDLVAAFGVDDLRRTVTRLLGEASRSEFVWLPS